MIAFVYTIITVTSYL